MFYKLKLLNRKNLYYVIFKYLYNFTRLEYFYSLHVIFFEKNKKIIKFQKSFFKKIKTLNYDGSKLSNLKVLELGGGSLFGLFPLFLKYKCKSFTNIDPFIEKNPAKINILKKVFKNRVKNFLKINDLDFNKYNQIKKFRKKKVQ